MKRLVVAVVLMASACGLNPQPFPPDNPDAALTNADGGKGDDGSFGDAAGGVADAEADSAPVPETDGGADAGADAASDATTDAPVDAPIDALLDVSTD